MEHKQKINEEGELSKRIRDTWYSIYSTKSLETICKEQIEAIEDAKKDIESNATFASEKLMIIDREKWAKWFGYEPLPYGWK